MNDIALTPDQVDLTLSLGASFTAADCLIELSGDGSYWQRIDYTGSRAYNIWEQISVDFTLAVPVQRLFIRFTPQGSQSYGVNFDDLKLTTGPGGQTVDLDGGDYRFPELPANWTAPTSSQAVVSGDYAFFTHWTQTVNTRKNLRNYSYCYDTRRHNPIWGAGPMHACYREGGFGLGAGRLRTVARCVLPSAVPGILGGVSLALGRCVGEVAALLFTAGTVAQIPDFAGQGIFALFDSCRTLAVHMYTLACEGLHVNEAYATSVVLLVLVLLLNAAMRLVATKMEVSKK